MVWEVWTTAGEHDVQLVLVVCMGGASKLRSSGWVITARCGIFELRSSNRSSVAFCCACYCV
jgi:hypothetical protein